MAKIPFGIKFRPQIESGEYKVITAKEQPVRIICWDRSTTYWKIIALVLAPDGRTENPFTYDVNGKESDGCLHNHELDLFLITPEPELSEFEVKLWEIMKAEGSPVGPREKFTNDDKKAFHEYSAELLELAKKELCESGEVTDWYAKGKAEALKDLPRWKKCHEGEKIGESIFWSQDETWMSHRCFAPEPGMHINFSELKKLPKEE